MRAWAILLDSLTTAFLTTFFFFKAPLSFAFPPPDFLGAAFGPRSARLTSACLIALKDCMGMEERAKKGQVAVVQRRKGQQYRRYEKKSDEDTKSHNLAHEMCCMCLFKVQPTR